jgi:hypothetical protein
MTVMKLEDNVAEVRGYIVPMDNGTMMSGG